MMGAEHPARCHVAGPCVGWRLRVLRWGLTETAPQVREEVGTSQGAEAGMVWSVQR